MRIHVKHLKSFGWCSAGCRREFAASNLNWSDFVSNGMELSDLTQKVSPKFAEMLEEKYGKE